MKSGAAGKLAKHKICDKPNRPVGLAFFVLLFPGWSVPLSAQQVAGQDEACYYVADAASPDELFRFDRFSEDEELIGNLGTGITSVEAAEFEPGTNILYAVNADDLGLVNLETGLYTKITVGSFTSAFFADHGRNPTGFIDGDSVTRTINDLDGLSFSPLTGVLFASERESGTTANDLLVALDPATGTILPNYFDTDGNPGTFEDFVEIQTATAVNRYDIDDIAFVPDGFGGEVLHGIANTSGGDDRMVIIDIETGAVSNPGGGGPVDYGQQDLEGLTADRYGNYFGSKGSNPGKLYDLNALTGSATNERILQGGDVEAVMCFLTPTDLELSMSASNLCPSEGEIIELVLTVRNTGTALASGLQVNDLLPAGLKFRSASFTGDFPDDPGDPFDIYGDGYLNDSYDENTGTWNIGVLPAGSSTVLTLEVEVENGTAESTLVNNAWISRSDSADPDSSPKNQVAGEDDDASLQITVEPTADIAISKTDNTTEYSPGQLLTYEITVSNTLGPSDVFGITVNDAFGPNFDSAEWTCSGTAGGVCQNQGSGDINDRIDLPVGATVSYTVQAQVGADVAVKNLINTASIAYSCAVVDNDLSNNSATDSNQIKPAILWRPDHESLVQPGATVIYAHQLDLAPGNGNGTLDINFTSNQDIDWTVYEDSDGNGVLGPADQLWVNGSAPGFVRQTFFVKGAIPASAPPELVDVSVFTAQYTVEGQSFSRTVTDLTTVLGSSGGLITASKLQALDAACDGSADGPFSARMQANPGECIIYEIEFRNVGTAAVTEVVIRDLIPSYTSYQTSSAEADMPLPPDLSTVVIQAPAGATGPIAWTFTGPLQAGSAGMVRFSVRIEP